MKSDKHRWAGRNATKDNLRHEIWGQLETTGNAVGKPWSAIPDFVGAQDAAHRLTQLDFWQAAQVVKSNPDRAQAWVRLFALKAGKTVYTPVPELTEDFPFLLLQPEKLIEKGITFDQVMYSEGAMAHGQRVEFTEMEPMDVCVVGSVAVSTAGGRTGKGAGFADLEMGIFREIGILADTCPVVTTVSDVQVVADRKITIEPHDTPLDWIITPTRTIETHSRMPRPGAMDWSAIREDQFRSIPFLRELRGSLGSS